MWGVGCGVRQSVHGGDIDVGRDPGSLITASQGLQKSGEVAILPRGRSAGTSSVLAVQSNGYIHHNFASRSRLYCQMAGSSGQNDMQGRVESILRYT